MELNVKPKQLEAKKIGDSGCYYLSIIWAVIKHAAEKLGQEISVDPIKMYEICNVKKWMDYDCFVNNPDKICEQIFSLKGIKTKVEVRHDTLDVKPKDNEFEITRYEQKNVGSTFAHFVVTDNNKIIYDPYGESNTVKNGFPVSKRIFTVTLL